jgi:hypothetical protein
MGEAKTIAPAIQRHDRHQDNQEIPVDGVDPIDSFKDPVQKHRTREKSQENGQAEREHRHAKRRQREINF